MRSRRFATLMVVAAFGAAVAGANPIAADAHGGDRKADLASPSLFDQCAPGGAWHDTYAPTANYPETRIPLEAQDWFFPLGDQHGESFGHTHLESCVPVGAVSGQDMPFDLRLRIHLGANIPPVAAGTVVKIDEVEVRGRNSFGKDVLVDRFMLPAGQSFLTCAAGQSCETTLHFDGRPLDATGGPMIDLHDSPRIPQKAFYQHGFTSLGTKKQLRLTAFGTVYQGGKQVVRMRAGLRVPFSLETCIHEPGFDCTRQQNYTDNTEGSGWFGSGKGNPGAYASVRYGDPIPTTPFASTDSWTMPLIFAADPCNTCLQVRTPITGYDIYIDPMFHMMPATPVISRDFSPTTSDLRANETVSWTGLAPGLHRMVVVVRQPVGVGAKALRSTNQGLLVIPFLVA